VGQACEGGNRASATCRSRREALRCESTAHASERSVFAARAQICLMERGRGSGAIVTVLKEVSVETRLVKSG